MNLRFRLLHSRGDARDGVLPIPTGGIGMADALELGGERLNDAQWRAANLCRIAWQGVEKGWQLSNASQTLVCALNGVRVLTGKAVVVVPGDMLEVGLLRFVVEAVEHAETIPARQASAQALDDVDEFFALLGATDSAPASSPSRGPASAQADRVAEDAFDLRDLATPTDAGRSFAARDDDPFGMLDIQSAPRRRVADPLAELLGEASPPSAGAPAASRGRSSAVTQSASAGTVARTATAATGSHHNPANALFDDLLDEFERVVRDPSQLSGRTDWEGFLAPDGERAPTMEEITRDGSSFALLRDILQPRESIDRVIEDFEPLGRASLCDVEEIDDVLRLFAPEVARNAPHAVPSLTRREHHDLSPDSYVRIGGVLDDDRG